MTHRKPGHSSGGCCPAEPDAAPGTSIVPRRVAQEATAFGHRNDAVENPFRWPSLVGGHSFPRRAVSSTATKIEEEPNQAGDVGTVGFIPLELNQMLRNQLGDEMPSCLLVTGVPKSLAKVFNGFSAIARKAAAKGNGKDAFCTLHDLRGNYGSRWAGKVLLPKCFRPPILRPRSILLLRRSRLLLRLYGGIGVNDRCNRFCNRQPIGTGGTRTSCHKPVCIERLCAPSFLRDVVGQGMADSVPRCHAMCITANPAFQIDDRWCIQRGCGDTVVATTASLLPELEPVPVFASRWLSLR